MGSPKRRRAVLLEQEGQPGRGIEVGRRIDPKRGAVRKPDHQVGVTHGHEQGRRRQEKLGKRARENDGTATLFSWTAPAIRQEGRRSDEDFPGSGKALSAKSIRTFGEC